jgi:hypothetical protein
MGSNYCWSLPSWQWIHPTSAPSCLMYWQWKHMYWVPRFPSVLWWYNNKPDCSK